MASLYDIEIVGAGRVGQTLGRLWAASGHRIGRVLCRTQKAAESAVAFIGAGTPATLVTPLIPLATRSVVCLTVPDDALAETAARFAAYPTLWRDVIVFHCSGALSSVVLQPLRQHGAAVASMHPLHAFGTPVAARQALEGVYWCVEGDGTALAVARDLVQDVHGYVNVISPEHKMLYHAAAAVAGNLLTGLMSLSFTMLEHCAIPPEQARAMLIRLSEGVLQRIKADGEVSALAGPISRGDVTIVAQHLQVLRTLPPQYLAVYKSLSTELLHLARRKDTDAEALAAIERVLGS